MKSNILLTLQTLVLGTALCLFCAPALAAEPDVSMYLLAKGQGFRQGSASAPAPRTDQPPFEFISSVNPSLNGSVSNATIQRTPGGAVLTMTNDSGDSELKVNGRFASKAALDAAFPNGSYRFTIATLNEGTKTPTLALGSDSFPTTPRVSNWAALQDVNPAADLLVTWDAFAGGTANDFVQFRVEDEMGTVFTSGENPGNPGALNGTSNSVSIPANTLQLGRAYRGSLLFARVTTDTTSYPDVTGIAGFFKETTFDVVTTGSAPDVEEYLIVKGQVFTQTSTGVPMPRLDEPPFEFSASVSPSSEGNVISATLQKPNGSTVALTTNAMDGSEFRLEGRYATKGALDTAFPNGTYHLDIVTAHQGTKSLTRATGSEDYPSTPHISNWTALQNTQAGSDVNVTWDAFVGGTANDYVQFSIDEETGDSIFETGNPGEATALNGTNTSATIPGGTLQPGRTYRARVLFARGSFETTAYPGVLGISAFYKQTSFPLVTVGTPPPAGRFYFSSAAFSGVESSGTLDVIIQRDSTEGAASILLTTHAGTATPDGANADYGAMTEPVTFGDGVGTRIVSISIIDDYVLEGDETILLTLSAPLGGAALGFPINAVGTIIDDEIRGRGVVQFSAPAYPVAEKAGFVNVIVTRTGGATGEVSVICRAESGTATNAGPHADFEPFSGDLTLTFGNGVTSLPIRIPITADTLDESDETFTVTLILTTGGAALGARSSATVTIKDDDTAGVLSFSSRLYSVPEADTNLAVIVRRAGGTASAVTVDLDITDGTAMEGDDYERSGGTSVTLEFGAGVTAVTNLFAIQADRLPEGDETILLALRNPTGGARVAGIATSTIKILDDEIVIQFAVENFTNKETAGTAVIFVERSGPVNAPATVTLSTTSNGSTATANEDYIPATTNVTFAPGQKRKPVVIRLVNDYLVESPETVQLVLENPTAPALLGLRDRATLHIASEDTAGIIGFTVASVTVPESRPFVPVTILRTLGLASNVTARLRTAALNTTIEGFHYVGTNLTLSFAARETRKVVNIPILPNGLAEGPKSFQVTLDNATGGLEINASRSSQGVIILDDDKGGVVGFSRAEYVVTENTTNALITITRTGGTASGVVVHFQTSTNGSTADPTRYQTLDTLVEFGEGETTKTVAVEINYFDQEVQGPIPQTVLLTLRDYMGGARPGLSNAVLKIVDDESSVAFTATTAAGNEGATVTLTVARAGALTTAVSVEYTTIQGTATEGTDYTGASGTLAFAANQASKTIVIPLTLDPTMESNETFTVVLQSPMGGVLLGAQSNIVVTISDRPDPNVVPLAGPEFFNSTTRGVTNLTFSKTYNITDGTFTDIDYERVTGNNYRITARKQLADTSAVGTETFWLGVNGLTGPGTYVLTRQHLQADASFIRGTSATSSNFGYGASDEGTTGTITVDGFANNIISGRFDIIISDDADSTKWVRSTGSFRAFFLNN